MSFRRFIAISFIMVVVLVTSGCSGVASGPRLDLVGKWQDLDYPDLITEFTIHDQFIRYFNGERVKWGTYRTNGNRLTLHYDSVCGGDKGPCDITLGFKVVDDTLILTDATSDFYFKRVK